MANQGKYSAWILVLILAVCLQIVFVVADCKESATTTAIEFTNAYFMLDTELNDFVCQDLAGDDEASATAAYLQSMSDEAREMGFGTGMVRKKIYHVETETIAQDAETATIHIKGHHRTCIHPVFTWVAKLFRLGRAHEFEETLKLVKEDGKWKVCGAPFGLVSEV